MAENDISADTESIATASLEILTGPARGTASWLSGNALDISLSDEDMIRIDVAGSEALTSDVVARLHRSGDGYEIEACEQSPVWINGERIDSKRLQQRDQVATTRHATASAAV